MVDAAHNFTKDGEPFPLRIILDVVMNHSGDNWEYEGGPKNYFLKFQHNFGAFRRNDRPIPIELRDAKFYHRCGQINDGKFDTFPENQFGDLWGLKDFENDDDEAGAKLINALIKCHCYWIREADVDGFRVDAVKHMGALASSRFYSGIREYAYSLGKRGFFLFGEIATADDALLDGYIGQNTSRVDKNETVFFGLDSVLDFRLAKGRDGDPHNQPLRNIIKGLAGPETLFNRLEAQRGRALSRGEIGRYLVTFIDNHDPFWQPSGRFSLGASDEQVIGAIGFLICALGTPCLYYGTEQGFEGKGSDNDIREAMFDQNELGRNLLNTECKIFKEIAKIAGVMRKTEHLRFGRMYYRQISGNDIDIDFPSGTSYTLAFSRVLYGSEVVVAYNISDKPRSDSVIVEADFHKENDTLEFLYPKPGKVKIRQTPGGVRFVKLSLAGHELQLSQSDLGFCGLFHGDRVEPGGFPVFGVQLDKIWFGGQNCGRRNLATVEAPCSPDPLGKMILGALCEMYVAAQGPRGLLSGDDKREFPATGFRLCNQGLGRRFVMKNQARMRGRT